MKTGSNVKFDFITVVLFVSLGLFFSMKYLPYGNAKDAELIAQGIADGTTVDPTYALDARALIVICALMALWQCAALIISLYKAR